MNKTEEEIQASYQRDNMADQYDDARFTLFGDKIRHILEVEAVNKAISELKNPVVVDVGTGTGRVAKGLKNLSKGIGVDTSEQMLRKAKQVLDDRWEVKIGDIFKIPLEDESVDVVVNFRLIRHFQKKDRERAYIEIKRILKPGGILVMDVLNRKRGIIGTIFDALLKLAIRLAGGKPGIYDEYYTIEEFKQEAKTNGFILKKYYRVGSYYWMWFPFSRFSKKPSMRKKMEKKLLHKALKMEMKSHSKKPFSWVVVMERE